MEAKSQRRVFAEEMDRRRAQLRLTWDQVAQRADISVATLRRLRNSDDPVSLDTMVGIDQALEWESGHAEARLAGRDPVGRRKEHSPPDDEVAMLDDLGIDPRKWRRVPQSTKDAVITAYRIDRERRVKEAERADRA